jgi:6-phosphofructokinase 2
MGIVTLTMNPSVDVSCAVEHVVADRKLRCGQPLREAGGGGLNVSRAIGHLGGKSAAVYPAGGATGALLTALLQAEGAVDRHPVPIAAWTRETFVVTESRTHRQFRFGFPGAKLSDEEWHRCTTAVADLLGPDDFLVVSGSLPPGFPTELLVTVAQLAQAHAARLVMDTSDHALHAAVRCGAYLLKPNIREFAGLVGTDHLDDQALEAAARRTVDAGRCEVLVVSLGAAGVAVASRREGFHRIAAPMVPVRSRVGAGDSTVAGIVLALSRGYPLLDAVRYGVAAGSAAVMSEGTGLCRLDDTERLFARLEPA